MMGTPLVLHAAVVPSRASGLAVHDDPADGPVKLDLLAARFAAVVPGRHPVDARPARTL
jgi:hypothetical protein